jgi:hypothetical protein
VARCFTVYGSDVPVLWESVAAWKLWAWGVQKPPATPQEQADDDVTTNVVPFYLPRQTTWNRVRFEKGRTSGGVHTRHSSFNFHEYQAGRAGFGKVRVFGDGLFSRLGCGYAMDRHHNLIIWAFVNTIGKVNELRARNYYCLPRGGRRQACRVEYQQRKRACILPVGTA